MPYDYDRSGPLNMAARGFGQTGSNGGRHTPWQKVRQGGVSEKVQEGSKGAKRWFGTCPGGMIGPPMAGPRVAATGKRQTTLGFDRFADSEAHRSSLRKNLPLRFDWFAEGQAQSCSHRKNPPLADASTPDLRRRRYHRDREVLRRPARWRQFLS